MAAISGQDRATFREQGFVVIRGVLDEAQLAAGRKLVSSLLAAEPPAEGHVGPYFLWPQFGADGHPLLDFYADAGIGALAAGLLRPELELEQPASAQLATTMPPWPHRPGGPHVDGLTPMAPDGRPATFSLLAGVWLTDQSDRDRGNLYIWPGMHLRFGDYLAARGADALVQVGERVPPYPEVELGEPVQATGPAGSVLLAHYLLGHNIGGHAGPADSGSRQTIYYRLHAVGHVQRWREVVTSPLLEFG